MKKWISSTAWVLGGVVAVLVLSFVYHQLLRPREAMLPNPYDETPDYEDISEKITATKLEEGLEEYTELGPRFTGSEGFGKLADQLISRFEKLGYRVLPQEHEVVVPKTVYCEILGEDGQPIPELVVHPWYPNRLRTATIAPPGLTGKVVQKGDPDDEDKIEALDLSANNIIMLRIREGFQDFANFGAKAVLYYDDEAHDTKAWHYRRKESHASINVPVLFVRWAPEPEVEEGTEGTPAQAEEKVEEGKVAGAGKDQEGTEEGEAEAEEEKPVRNAASLVEFLDGRTITLRCRVDWTRVKVRNIVAILDPKPGFEEVRDETLLISAHYDTWSAIPELAPGARQTLSVQALMLAAKHLAQTENRERLRRKVAFFVSAGRGQAAAGSRYLMSGLGQEPEPEKAIERHEEEVEEYSDELILLEKLREVAPLYFDTVRDRKADKEFWRKNREGMTWRQRRELMKLWRDELTFVLDGQAALAEDDALEARVDWLRAGGKKGERLERYLVENKRAQIYRSLTNSKPHVLAGGSGYDKYFGPDADMQQQEEDDELLLVPEMYEETYLEYLGARRKEFEERLALRVQRTRFYLDQLKRDREIFNELRGPDGSRRIGGIELNFTDKTNQLVLCSGGWWWSSRCIPADREFVLQFEKAQRALNPLVKEEERFHSRVPVGDCWSCGFWYVSPNYFHTSKMTFNGYTSFALVTKGDDREFVATPMDTPDKIKWDNVATQVRIILGGLEQIALGGAKFIPISMPAHRGRDFDGMVTSVRGNSLVPNHPEAGAVVQMVGTFWSPASWLHYTNGGGYYTGHMDNYPVVMADEVGRFRLRNCFAHRWWKVSFHAARSEPESGDITWITDLGYEGKYPTQRRRVYQVSDLTRIVLFRCTPIHIFKAENPQRMKLYDRVEARLTRGFSQPKRYFAEQFYAGEYVLYLEPDAQFFPTYLFGAPHNQSLLQIAGIGLNISDQDFRQEFPGVFPEAEEEGEKERAPPADHAEETESTSDEGDAKAGEPREGSDVAAVEPNQQAGEEATDQAQRELAPPQPQPHPAKAVAGDQAASEVAGKGHLAADATFLYHPEDDLARSMAAINTRRMLRYQNYGLLDEPTVEAAKEAGALLLEGARQRREGKHYEAFSTMKDSLAYSTSIHPVIKDSKSEAVYGIIFYLLLLIPFAFFMEKLVFGHPDIRWQIVIVGGIFLLVYCCLYLIHPAFQIVRSSFMILLGFITLILSILVTFFVSTKFRAAVLEYQKLIHGQQVAAEVTKASAALTGFLLGINNMRKRKVRTALTATTLVLITFVMICFTAVDNDFVEVQYPIGKAPFTGIEIRKNTLGHLGTQTTVLVNAFENDYDVAVRRWDVGGLWGLMPTNKRLEAETYISPAEIDNLPVTIVREVDGETLRWTSKGSLGFGPDPEFLEEPEEPEPEEQTDAAAEDGGDGKAAEEKPDAAADDEPEEEPPPVYEKFLLAGDSWFETESEKSCVLPLGAAKALGITLDMVTADGPKPTIVLKGRKLEVVNLFDEEKFDAYRTRKDAPLNPVALEAEKAAKEKEEAEKKAKEEAEAAREEAEAAEKAKGGGDAQADDDKKAEDADGDEEEEEEEKRETIRVAGADLVLFPKQRQPKPETIISHFKGKLRVNEKEPVNLDKMFITKVEPHEEDAVHEHYWFRNDEPQTCFIPARMAAEMKLTPEMIETKKVQIRVQGTELVVKGIYDAGVFDQIHDMDQESLAPYDVESIVGRPREEDTEEDEMPEMMKRLSGDDIIICNDRSTTHGWHVSSIAINLGDLAHKKVREVLDRYLEKTGSKAFYGIGDTAYFGAKFRRPKGSNYLELLIPLLIASLTVLNTMRGSVYERRDEIYVYNAVGLNPFHIFFLFMAEACVYAVVGALGGYLIANFTGVIIGLGGWDVGLTINYSSIYAVMYSVVIMVAVMVSTWFPARAAAKLAAPADQMKWHVPDPVDGVISFVLPFTFSQRDRVAIISYFLGWFDEFGEGSSGKFYAAPPSCALERFGGKAASAVRVVNWLRPYDLGISQEVCIRFTEDPENEQTAAHLTLTRLSGDISSWQRTNYLFLKLLRKHFLDWRVVPEQEKEAYLERARKTLTAQTPA